MINHNQELDGTLAPSKGGTANLGTPLRPINDIQTGTITTTGKATIDHAAVTGALVASGGLITGATTGASGATVTGQVYVGAVDAAFTLPAASGNGGGIITIITGVASAGTGLTIAPIGSDKIQAMTKASGGTALTDKTTVTNTGATDVVGDCMVLQSDGASNWRAISIIGIWA
jgi:hypothetical protein